MLNEAAIRDQLAERLTILELGLVLLAKEYPLPNGLGSKGFIDILAKDRLGNRVIIEVKRSNSTARQALHEILKYAALFVANEGLPLSKMRCFVVSTEWHELMVPFAQFVSVAEFQAEGFKLHLSSDSVTGADRIEVPQLPESISPFRQHGAYFFREEAARNASVLTLQNALKDSGAESFVLIALNYLGTNTAVIYPYCTYFVPIEIRKDVEAQLLILVAEEAVDEEDSDRTSFEDSFHEMVGQRASVVYDECGQGVTYEIGYPEKFVGMQEAGWKSAQILREGRVGIVAADDAEILRMVAGVDGQSEVRFYRMAAPRLKLGWAEIRSQSERCLIGNDTWKQGFEWFCNWVENTRPNTIFSAMIYNPLQLPIGLYKLVAHGDGRYMPQMELIAASEQEGRFDSLLGALLWDGTTIPSDFDSTMKSICGGVEQYFFEVHVGTAWQMDSATMAQHGLRYGLFHLHVEKDAFHAEELVNTVEGLTACPFDASQCRPFSEFAAAAEMYLDTVVSEMDRWQFGL